MGLSIGGEKLKADNKNSSLRYLEGNTREVCQENIEVVEGFLLRKRNKNLRKRSQYRKVQERGEGKPTRDDGMGWDRKKQT